MKTWMRILLLCFWGSQISVICFAQSRIITTYAGPGLPVNGARATTQSFGRVESVIFDGSAGFYFSDMDQNRVYRVAADGTVTLVAGSSREPGFSGDGGPATSAKLTWPEDVAVDSAGNLYIGDYMRIRKVTPAGVINTVAGGGTEIPGDGGPATSANVGGTAGIAIDSAGNLYFTDMWDYRIRKVTPDGTISTVAGNGTSGFKGDGGPATSAMIGNSWGIAVDTAGNLYIADTSNNRIRKVTPEGTINTVAGNGTRGFSGDGGPAISAKLDGPFGVTVDPAGNILIADSNNNRIRKVTPEGIISTIAGNENQGFSGDGGPAASAQLNNPMGVAVDSAGNIYIADTDNHRIRRVTPEGTIDTVAGSALASSGPAASALLFPIGVAADTTGNLYIADTPNDRICKVTPAGMFSTVAGNGNSGFSGDGGPAASAQLHSPQGVAVDAAGNFFIADADNYRIRKVTPAGAISTVAGGGTASPVDGVPATSVTLWPSSLAVDTAGNLYFESNNRIRKVTPAGIFTTVAGNGSQGFSGDGGPAASAMLNFPSGIAVDSTGNLYIADQGNYRIRKVTPDGVIDTVAGNGTPGFSGDGGPAASAQLDLVSGIAVDAAGNLYITSGNFYIPELDVYYANLDNNRIRKVTPEGTINTIAGNGTSGYSGDGGSATSAMISPYIWISGVAVDTIGNLYIADAFNSRVRKVSEGSRIPIHITSGSSAISGTNGLNETTQGGYAALTVNSGTPPYGTAVFSFKQNGVTVSEAGVPASPPTTSARVFIDYRSDVPGIPGRPDSGAVDINTGIGIVNYGAGAAAITYTLLDADGAAIAAGQGTLAAGNHFAKFINQLPEVAPDFVLPADFQFASLNIASDQPLSVIALRMTTNQRGEALFTTTPVADGNQTPATTPIFFPQLADGGGWTTSLVLMNTSSSIENGSLDFFDKNGAPLVVHQAGSATASSFPYSIQAGGVFRFQTDGSSESQNVGWARVTPNSANSTPVGSGVFGYNPVNILTTESGIPSALSTTHAQIFVDVTRNHNTGLAIANLNDASADIAIQAFQTDGVFEPVKMGQGTIPMAGLGHEAQFATQLFPGLPAAFIGVLDISSSTPFAAVTVRSLYNERQDFLVTTFPVADATRSAPSPIIFPHIADGGGYETQFILIGPTGEASATLGFYGEDGQPLAIGK